MTLFRDEKTPVFVYDDGGTVKGYVFCRLLHQDSGSLQRLDTLYIDDLCIDSQSRGMGIDKVLCSALVDRLCHKAFMVNMTDHIE